MWPTLFIKKLWNCGTGMVPRYVKPPQRKQKSRRITAVGHINERKSKPIIHVKGPKLCEPKWRPTPQKREACLPFSSLRVCGIGLAVSFILFCLMTIIRGAVKGVMKQPLRQIWEGRRRFAGIYGHWVVTVTGDFWSRVIYRTETWTNLSLCLERRLTISRELLLSGR